MTKAVDKRAKTPSYDQLEQFAPTSIDQIIARTVQILDNGVCKCIRTQEDGRQPLGTCIVGSENLVRY